MAVIPKDIHLTHTIKVDRKSAVILALSILALIVINKVAKRIFKIKT